ncbi:MAG: cupin domain-containing protein [Chloroflexi bacterium]|nr:cupin domain-containing protein [Chloroflexota bacterium]
MQTSKAKTSPTLQPFQVTAPLLKQGRMDRLLARTDKLQVVIKSYAEGGENFFHTHTTDDHAFVVLMGEATVYGMDGTTITLKRNEGVLLPRGAYYRFHSSGKEPLVMLRAGTAEPGDRRLAPDGTDMRQHQGEVTYAPPVPIEGAFFR